MRNKINTILHSTVFAVTQRY